MNTFLTVDTSLAELVEARPGASGVLESFGLDYCCGGARSLGVASRALGIEPQTVVDALEALDAPNASAGTGAAWSSMAPAELVDHIETTHHVGLHEELPRLVDLAAKVAGVHSERHPELWAIHAAVVGFAEDLELHMLREERVLFPMIRELAAAVARGALADQSVAAPISAMMREHEGAGEMLARLRSLTHGYDVPIDGCASYRALYERLAAVEADTHLHIHKENNVLFPSVLRMEAPAGAN